MPAVSNTSPLLNLAIIGQLDLVREQFGEVLISEAVLKELRVDEPLPGSARLRQALDLGWLRVVKAEDQPLIALLMRTLDLGESEAIALASRLDPEQLLLDERDGRRVAKSLGLPVTGVIGILLRAKREGAITSLGDALAALEAHAGFRIAHTLVREMLLAAGEASPDLG